MNPSAPALRGLLLCCLLPFCSPIQSWALGGGVSDPSNKGLQVTAATLAAAGHLLAGLIENAFTPTEIEIQETPQLEPDNNAPTEITGPAPLSSKKTKKRTPAEETSANIVDLTETKNEEPVETEPFNRTHLLGNTLDNSFQEVVLPSTDNNCALFGIYGRTDVKREEVVEELLANGDSLLIRQLMAPEIFEYMQREARRGFLNSPFDEDIRDVFLKLIQLDSDHPVYNQARPFMLSPLIFNTYVREVLGRRIGNDAEDPYPLLELIPYPESRTTAGTGSLAAIAAMRGVSLVILTRAREDGSRLALGGYEHTPVKQKARTIYLIHTSAAPTEEPDAFNHFNLYTPVNQELLAAFKEEQETGSDWNQVTPLGALSLRPVVQNRNTSQVPTYRLESSIKQMLSHRLQFNECELKEGPTLHSYALLDADTPVDWEDKRTSERYQFQSKMGRFQDFSSQKKEAFSIIFQHHLQEFSQLLIALETNYRAASRPLAKKLLTKKRSQPRQTSNVASEEHVLQEANELAARNYQSLLDEVAAMQKTTPSLRNLQLILFHFDRILAERTQLLQQYQDYISQNPALLNVNDLEGIATYCQNAIAIIRYFLGQLIDLCRTHGYEPFVPYYKPQKRSDQDSFLNTALQAAAKKLNEDNMPKKPAQPARPKNKKTKQKKAIQKPGPVTPPTPTTTNDSQEAQASNEDKGTAEEPIIEESILIIESTEPIVAPLIPENTPQEEATVLALSDAIWDAYDEAHLAAEIEAFYEDMRQKKVANAQNKVATPAATNRAQQIQTLIVLTPEERAAFQTFLENNARPEVLNAYQLFQNAGHLELSLKDIDMLASHIADLLRQFLKGQKQPNGEPLFSDKAINDFVNTFLRGHQETFHNFHPVKGDKVPSEWVKLRHAPWIALGIMPVKNYSKTTNTAHAYYQANLVRRVMKQ